MGLEHNFLYMSSEKYYDEVWKKIEYNPLRIENNIISEFDYVSIHDDVLRYFNDYFTWIRFYNPCKKENIYGLCHYGVTTIYKDALFQVKNLIDGLLIIFSIAPNMIELHGNYIINNNTGCYEKIYIKKQEIICVFHKLNKLIEKAINEDGYIIHFGI